jgi:hypothetical protein
VCVCVSVFHSEEKIVCAVVHLYIFIPALFEIQFI